MSLVRQASPGLDRQLCHAARGAQVSLTPKVLCVVSGSFPEREKLPGHTVKCMQLYHKTTDLAFLWNNVQKGGLDINSAVKV